jgi:AraC-like DNA-binding protein
MDPAITPVHDRRMRPFRMVGDEGPAGALAIRVIGWRMPFPEPVRGTAQSWFCCLFHDAVRATTADGETDLPPETALIVPVGEPFTHRPLGTRLLRSWIRCDGRDLAGMLAAAGLASRCAYPLSAGHAVGEALLALHRACTHPRRSPALERDLLQAWMRVVARDLAGAATPLGIDAVRARLEATYAQPQRLDELARLAGCSRAQLCRRFRAAAGCSPIAYVMRLRLEAAREQLVTTELGIAEIAAACGFSDRFHFTRAFSARYGLGPAACRRQAGA